jgi:hypothetical protein
MMRYHWNPDVGRGKLRQTSLRDFTASALAYTGPNKVHPQIHRLSDLQASKLIMLELVGFK